MEIVGAVIIGLGFLGCMVYWVVGLYRFDQLKRVRSSPVQMNDDESTKATFKAFLEEAQSSMDIYDDGDNVDGSIYMNEEITGLVKRKLEDNPDFRIRCLFNFDEPNLLFRRAFKGFTPQLEIKTRDRSKPRLDIHYKIIDDGAKAYLARHDPGSRNRLFRIVDCTTVSESNRKRASDVILGRYKRDFGEAFMTASTTD